MTLCSNDSCPKSKEASGGRFVYRGSKWYCEDCAANLAIMNSAKNLWDFVTPHLNGEKIHVTSLGHLRELERTYGVSNHAANHMEKNWSSPPPERAQPIRSSGGGYFGEER